MQTRLPFSYESNPRLTLVRIGYQSTIHRSSPHFRLLRTFPTVWMTEYKLYIVLYSIPQCRPVCMGISNEISSTIKEIGQKVAKDIDGRLVARGRTKLHTIHLQLHRVRS